MKLIYNVEYRHQRKTSQGLFPLIC